MGGGNGGGYATSQDAYTAQQGQFQQHQVNQVSHSQARASQSYREPTNTGFELGQERRATPSPSSTSSTSGGPRLGLQLALRPQPVHHTQQLLSAATTRASSPVSAAAACDGQRVAPPSSQHLSSPWWWLTRCCCSSAAAAAVAAESSRASSSHQLPPETTPLHSTAVLHLKEPATRPPGCPNPPLRAPTRRRRRRRRRRPLQLRRTAG
jgi:hypothetical protein